MKGLGLRAKLLLGYAVFIAALVLLGAWSAWRLHDMGKVSRRIMSENYDSVVAAQEMKESLERQDSAALFALIGAREKALTQLREHRARFDANFQKAANNITEIGEPDAIEAIRRERDVYYQRFDSFLSRATASTQANDLALRNEYVTQLEPQRGFCPAEGIAAELLCAKPERSVIVVSFPLALLPVRRPPGRQRELRPKARRASLGRLPRPEDRRHRVAGYPRRAR